MTKTLVTFRAEGWPEDSGRTGLKLCCTQNIARCDAPPIWKVERPGRGYTTTGYYCDAHLSADDRRAA